MTYLDELKAATAGSHAARPWPVGHVGCNVTTCPNGKCRSTGECIDQRAARAHVKISERHEPCPEITTAAAIAALVAPEFASGDWVTVEAESPPLVPTLDSLLERVTVANLHAEIPVWPLPHAPAPSRTIIAFTGLAGAGKSTAAAHLVKHRGFERVRFAGPLKAMMLALGCTTEQVDGSEKETPCDLLGGKTPRHAMQTLGTEWGRDLIASDLWIRAWNAALAKVPAGVPVVVDDCRFPNEADAVNAAGGILVRIERPGAGATGYQHSSETFQLPASATLHNTLSANQLCQQVDRFLADLSWAERAAV
jgi:hypothetical protein